MEYILEFPLKKSEKKRSEVKTEKAEKGVKMIKFDLAKYFDKVLSAPSGENPPESKAELIRNDDSFDENNSWVVGDTEADIEAGKILEINTIGVLSGIRNKKKMKELEPDYLIEDITELPELMFFEEG